LYGFPWGALWIVNNSQHKLWTLQYWGCRFDFKENVWNLQCMKTIEGKTGVGGGWVYCTSGSRGGGGTIECHIWTFSFGGAAYKLLVS